MATSLKRHPGLPETFAKLSIKANASIALSSSDEGSFISDQCDTPAEGNRTQTTQQAPRRNRQRRQETPKEDKPKSLVDPRKYKTKMCRNWKATGQCPYEHTCCYAHGEVETRTLHQNNTVLSSLGYFSGVMLLAMQDDRPPARGPRPEKKHAPQAPAQPAPRPPELLNSPSSSALSPSAHLPPYSPLVHSPYAFPEGPTFGSVSGPGSPLNPEDTQMPTYSLRLEAGPKPPPACGPYYPCYPLTGLSYELPEDCYPLRPSYSGCPLSPPVAAFPAMSPEFPNSPLYNPQTLTPSPALSDLEAQQAAMGKHPAVRQVQSGELSPAQVQQVLQDIMHPGTYPRKSRKAESSRGDAQE